MSFFHYTEENNMKSLNLLKSMMFPFHAYKLGEKSWGFEYWFENNSQYCGKIINVQENCWSSYGAFHYHKIKDETFLVLSGTLMLDILDLTNVSKSRIASSNEIGRIEELDDITVNRYYLEPYNYIRVKPGVLHRFSAFKEEAMFTETSTTHREKDSYRIELPSPEYQLTFNVDPVHDPLAINTSKFSYKLREKEEITI